ncbi:MAG TPA: glycosyltransferase family 4 protein, partial [Devosia sp.]|nr:glycosyltransferase family 4 protein [Devosia sp.]
MSWGLADAVRRHAVALNLVQSPNERSSHVVPTPSGGGVGIAVAGSLAGILVCVGAPAYFWWVLAASVLIACVGLVDDRFDLSSRIRIVIHFLVVGGLLFALPALPSIATPLGGLPAPLLYAMALVAGVWWVNLFNFMDGIDGIAASQAVFMAVGLVALIVTASGTIQANPAVFWLVFTASASAGFLVLNWPPAKVFMGDVGSNYLAVIILALGLHEIATGRLSYAAFLILVAAFSTDATITLVRRAAMGERWFAAHRLHAYQKLSRRRGHGPVTLLYLAINLLWLYPLAYMATIFPQNSLLAGGAAY